jgi:hypothetical protein
MEALEDGKAKKNKRRGSEELPHNKARLAEEEGGGRAAWTQAFVVNSYLADRGGVLA